MWDLVGQHTAPFSPGDVAKHPHGLSLVTVYPEKEDVYTPWRFTNVRRLAHHGGRNAAPPGVSLSGPFVTARYRAALASWPAMQVRTAISVRERTRTGRIRFI
ncbi:MAG: hypothetical protein OER74_19960 [Desulfobacteraceae bacterium]|nr:hypothetical protein [Desulfobacteraceae bacterium]